MRKMIKWKAFYSIPELSKVVDELEDKKNKVEKPTLLPDAYEEMNYNLETALNKNQIIEIKYFKNGMFKTKSGNIKKIDPINKYLIIDNERIYFKNIIKLQ